MKKLLNISYGSVHGTYWLSFAVFFSFASVFLLAQSYTNTMIGIILALGNVIAIIFQPFLADFADRTKRFSLIEICIGLIICVLLAILGVILSKPAGILMSFSYIMIVGFVNMMQPLINTLSFKLQESGFYVNFGLTRSVGSMTYAVATTLLGTLVGSFGVGILPYIGIIVFLLVILSLLFTNSVFLKAKSFNESLDGGASHIDKNLGEETKEDIDIRSFIRRHKLFFLLNLGVFGVFFSNQSMNGFMLQIVNSVGGNSRDMGLVFTMIATFEIPTLIFYDKIRRYISTRKLLKISAIAYIFQIGICYLSKNVWWIFGAQLFQPLSFALLLPSMVHIINETMEDREAVKGQSMFTMTVMFTTVLATLVGGIVIDELGVKTLLLISTAITTLGSLIIFLAMKKMR